MSNNYNNNNNMNNNFNDNRTMRSHTICSSNSSRNDQNNNVCLSNDPVLYQEAWSTKIDLYNKWLTEGNLCYERKKLKEGIISIVNESEKIEFMLDKFSKNGDKKSENIILKLKSDMAQTCYRYEFFLNGRKMDYFYSPFFGNNKKYTFSKRKIIFKK